MQTMQDELKRREKWYRYQCSLYSVRLDEWLEAHPGRRTKARTSIEHAAEHLGKFWKTEEQAHAALVAIEEFAFDAPPAAQKVIRRAMGSTA